MRCRYCHSKENLTKDHIIPKSKGGTRILRNIQILCFFCNQNKKDLAEDELERLFRWFKYIQDNREEPLNY